MSRCGRLTKNAGACRLIPAYCVLPVILLLTSLQLPLSLCRRACHGSLRHCPAAVQHYLFNEAAETKDERNRNRLLIPLLITRQESLCCAVDMIFSKIAVNTPVDVIVFSDTNEGERWWKNDCLGRHTQEGESFTLSFRDRQEGWETPEMAGPQEEWSAGWFGEDYRRMGHFRLTYQMHLARSLGYKYVLQLDDDSLVLGSPPNLVKAMDAADAKFGARVIASDIILVSRGLPELARFFLSMNGIDEPTGPIFEHCQPPNIRGLFTANVSVDGPPYGYRWDDAEGWDMAVMHGNFIIINVDFWFERRVQDFVNLAISTGGPFRNRWNEQGVMAMVWQLFVPKRELLMFDFEYQHPGKPCEETDTGPANI